MSSAASPASPGTPSGPAVVVTTAAGSPLPTAGGAIVDERVVRELFEAIADGGPRAVRAGRALMEPDRTYVVAVLEPLRRSGWRGAARTVGRLQRAAPGALCDPGPERVRALLPVDRDDERRSLARLDAKLDRIARGERLVAGRSGAQRREAARSGLVEATAAARIVRALLPAGGARAWDDLGAYRYLVDTDGEVEPDPRHAAAIGLLWAYDERRGTDLVGTLERYLTERSVVPTARALSIHPNTLRQRLERIEHLTVLAVADEDLLSLELAIKRHRLRRYDSPTTRGSV